MNMQQQNNKEEKASQSEIYKLPEKYFFSDTSTEELKNKIKYHEMKVEKGIKKYREEIAAINESLKQKERNQEVAINNNLNSISDTLAALK
jgi:hypothetical protein